MTDYKPGQVVRVTYDSMGRRREVLPVSLRLMRKVRATPEGCWQRARRAAA